MSSSIKLNTQVKHTQVEQLIAKVLFSDELQPSAYLKLIICLYISYLSLEKSIRNFSLTGDLMIKRSKLNFFLKDIESLEHDFGLRNTFELSNLSFEVKNAENALGVLYVMEGATLGGKIITNHLNNFDWINVERHCNFFNSYGSQRGKMWSEFSDIANNHFNNFPERNDDYEVGANLAFDFIYTTLVNTHENDSIGKQTL